MGERVKEWMGERVKTHKDLDIWKKGIDNE